MAEKGAYLGKEVQAVKIFRNGRWIEYAPVVRCKDCKHSEPCICVVCEEGNTMICRKFLNHVRKDHFCSYGERKE